eukprot:NODE_3275_length_952_cov_12.569214_g2721_i0.p2 GENE.NODE_3275_length_952_cov_12.569214_g2721_i0~~NODE_3275_length_952_cov_12.569214_g2721_i0.p2  ORF type:complete len:256 (+),score=55.35 NODE_3275_length_952_cov_12.569214_g2721_i0:78-845(+)
MTTARGLRLLLLGPPGVGKGTYAERASQDFGIPHLAAGDLIRHQIKAGTPLGLKVKDVVNAGQLIPDDMVTDLVLPEVKERLKLGYLLDGFPRTASQAERFLASFTKTPPLDAVLHLTQPYEVIIEKLSKRRVCSNTKCGWTCNLASIDHPCGIKMAPLNPKVEGKCDKCGSDMLQRADDNEATIRDRLNTFDQETAPLVQFFEKKQPGLVRPFAVLGGVTTFYPKFKTLLEEIRWQKTEETVPETEQLYPDRLG